jgi:hypothetical protein
MRWLAAACGTGSQLEGGGQILRNAVALSALTGSSIHVDKIRAGGWVTARLHCRNSYKPGRSGTYALAVLLAQLHQLAGAQPKR